MNILKTMRNMALLKYLLWIVVISFIAAIFFIWGGGGDTGRSGTTIFGDEYAVSVDGNIIGPSIMRMQYGRQVDQMRQMLGSSFKPDFIKGTAGRIATQFANQLIMEEMARKQGFTVSDLEVATLIQKIYKFEDPSTGYLEMLSRQGVRPQEFEEFVRGSILVDKVRTLLEDTSYFSDAELMRLYTLENEKYKAQVALVRNSDFRAKVAQPTEPELRAFYEKEKAQLNIPDKRTFKYLFLTESSVRSTVALDEAQVRSYYDSHKEEFSTQAGQRRASHILVKTPQGAKPAEIEAAKKKSQDFLARIQKGESFEELAKQFSEDGSAQKGGDLGWFGREAMVKPFADAVFDECQTVGQVVGPTQSDFGFHVIKLTGIGGELKPFAEVREEVKQKMLMGDPGVALQIKAQFDKAASELKKAKDESAINQFASAWKMHVTPVTVPFSQDEPIPGLGTDKDLQKAIFEAKKDEWVSPIEFRKGWLRFQVNSVLPAHQASFEEAKGKLTQKIIEERASKMAEETASGLASAKGVEDLKTKAKAAGVTPEETSLLKLDDSIASIGQDKAVAKSLMAAEVGATVGPLKSKNGWVVAVVVEHAAVDPVKFSSEKDKFLKSQRQKEAERIMEDYVAKRRPELEAKGAIKINENLVKELDSTVSRRG